MNLATDRRFPNIEQERERQGQNRGEKSKRDFGNFTSWGCGGSRCTGTTSEGRNQIRPKINNNVRK